MHGLSFPIFVFVKMIFVKIWLEEERLRALWELQCFGIQCIGRFFWCSRLRAEVQFGAYNKGTSDDYHS